jgi:hypothetical protein
VFGTRSWPLGTIIKPFVTADWWEKSLDLIKYIACNAPCYEMRFDKSSAIVPEIEALAGSAAPTAPPVST